MARQDKAPPPRRAPAEPGSPLPVRARWQIAARLAAAIAGGYLLATACILGPAAWATSARPATIMSTSLLSYAVYTAAVAWAFSAATAWRAWLGLLAPSALLLGAGWLWGQP
ncbi:hypothetical protein D9M68_507740 [compost metagenome]